MSDGSEPFNRGLIIPPFNMDWLTKQQEWLQWLEEFNTRNDVAFAHIEGRQMLRTNAAEIIFNPLTPDDLLLLIQENSGYKVKVFVEKLLQAQYIPDLQFDVEGKDGRVISVKGDMEPIYIKKKFIGYIITIKSIIRPIEDMVNEALEQKDLPDYDELLEVETEIANLMRMLLIGLAHDVGTPLSLINTQLYLLKHQKDKLTDNEFKNRLSKVESQVSRIKKMADGALKDAMNLGSIDTELEPLNFNALVTSIVNDFQQLILANGYKVSINLTVDKNVPRIINSSQNLLSRILENLISNAVKYSKDSDISSINVKISFREGQLIVEIDDNGIGIPQEKAAVLFDRFGRAANVGAKEGRGAGLVIVKRMVEQLNGDIYYQRSERGGSLFTFELPVQRGFTGFDVKTEVEEP